MQDFIKLSTEDGSWREFQADWEAQCKEVDEDFEDFAFATMSVITPLIENPEKRAGVYATRDENRRFSSVCHVNVAYLPKYTGPVMRVRHMTLSPSIDYGESDAGIYAGVITSNFFGAYALSYDTGDMQASHLKFHLRSPADHSFFTLLGKGLSELEQFESVQKTGSWLYVSKREK